MRSSNSAVAVFDDGSRGEREKERQAVRKGVRACRGTASALGIQIPRKKKKKKLNESREEILARSRSSVLPSAVACALISRFRRNSEKKENSRRGGKGLCVCGCTLSLVCLFVFSHFIPPPLLALVIGILIYSFVFSQRRRARRPAKKNGRQAICGSRRRRRRP